MCGLVFLMRCLRFQKQNRITTMIRKAAIPPITPPTMAEWLLELGDTGAAIEVLVDIADAIVFELVFPVAEEDEVVSAVVVAAFSVELVDVEELLEVLEDLEVVVVFVVDEVVVSSSGHTPDVHGLLEQQPL